MFSVGKFANKFRLSNRIEPNVLKGQKFIITEDYSTSCLTTYRAPYTGGFNCVVPKGTIFEIASDSHVEAKGFARNHGSA